MTIPSTPRKAGPYLGDDFVTVFAFNFRVFAEEDIRVVFTDALGVETDLVLTSQYTVALNPDQNTSPGGFVTSLVGALEIGATITILGDIDYSQAYDIPDGGAFRPQSLENQLDRTIMQMQQLLERLNRTIRLGVATKAVDLVFPEPEPGSLIAWDESGKLENLDAQDILQLAGSFGFQYQTYLGTGVATNFVLPVDPGSLGNLAVYVAGVRQTPAVQYAYLNTTLVFAAPPGNGVVVLVVIGETIGIGIPSAGSVTNDRIGPSAVTADKIGSNAVTTAKIADGAVTAVKLATDSVIESKIANGAVTSTKLGNLAVLTANLGNAQTTYQKLQNVAPQSIVGNPFSISASTTEIGIGAGFTLRNRIINGAALIAQRAGASVTSGAAVYGGPDRFLATNVSAGGVFTQVQGTVVVDGITENTVRQATTTANTNVTGGNAWGGILQIIEGFNCFDMVGKPAVLSFVFNTNLSGNYSVAVRDQGGNRSFVTSFAAVAGVVQRVTIFLPVLPAALAIPRTALGGLLVQIGAINTGTLQTVGNAGAWQVGTLIAAVGHTNWGLSIGAAIEVTQLQLEVGQNPTPYERSSIGVVAQQCHRYFFSTAVTQGGYLLAGNGARSSYAFPCEMRSALPTLTLTGGTLTNVASITALNPSNFKADLLVTATATGSYLMDNSLLTASAEL